MEIKEHRLQLFMELYKHEFGVELTREQAYEKASSLLRYTLMCLKPLAKLDEDEIIKKPNEN